MNTKTMIEHQRSENNSSEQPWYHRLCEVVGLENILQDFEDLLAYGRDRWPIANLQYRFGNFPASVPSLVLLPGTYEEVSQILKTANEYRLAVIPYGAGSGVLGGTIPMESEIVIDLKRLNRMVDIDEISGLATAQAGMNGELFEAALNKRKFTMGHFPQSLNTSTIGGWLSCRSAGQASTRYGKIEDMVVGLKALLPDGRLVEVKPVPRRAVGPSIKDIFVGAEGTMGIILEGTFRIWPYPEYESVHVVGFEDYLMGLEALRKIMQAELRPAVVRLYDEHESRKKIEKFPEFKKHPCLVMLSFNGLRELVEIEERLALRICSDVGGIKGSPEPAFEWMQHRFESMSPKPVSQGKMLDTIEVAGSWMVLADLYEGMKEAVLSVNSEVHFGAHWSHAYSDGACMYITFIIAASDKVMAANEHTQIWDNCMKACLKAGGTISHHHGVGYFRSKWLMEELGVGHEILQHIKDGVDPHHIMNPGKLGLK
jgi:alkyldihydroxyacetonephosphate synthase